MASEDEQEALYDHAPPAASALLEALRGLGYSTEAARRCFVLRGHPRLGRFDLNRIVRLVARAGTIAPDTQNPYHCAISVR